MSSDIEKFFDNASRREMAKGYSKNFNTRKYQDYITLSLSTEQELFDKTAADPKLNIQVYNGAAQGGLFSAANANIGADNTMRPFVEEIKSLSGGTALGYSDDFMSSGKILSLLRAVIRNKKDLKTNMNCRYNFLKFKIMFSQFNDRRLTVLKRSDLHEKICTRHGVSPAVTSMTRAIILAISESQRLTEEERNILLAFGDNEIDVTLDELSGFAEYKFAEHFGDSSQDMAAVFDDGIVSNALIVHGASVGGIAASIKHAATIITDVTTGLQVTAYVLQNHPLQLTELIKYCLLPRLTHLARLTEPRTLMEAGISDIDDAVSGIFFKAWGFNTDKDDYITEDTDSKQLEAICRRIYMSEKDGGCGVPLMGRVMWSAYAAGTIDFFKSCYNFDERHINEIDFDDVMLDSCLSLETTKLICPKSLAPLQVGGQMPDWLQPFLSSGLPAGSAFRDAWTRMQEQTNSTGLTSAPAESAGFEGNIADGFELFSGKMQKRFGEDRRLIDLERIKVIIHAFPRYSEARRAFDATLDCPIARGDYTLMRQPLHPSTRSRAKLPLDMLRHMMARKLGLPSPMLAELVGLGIFDSEGRQMRVSTTGLPRYVPPPDKEFDAKCDVPADKITRCCKYGHVLASETGVAGMPNGKIDYHNAILREIITCSNKYSGINGICNPSTLFNAVPLGPNASDADKDNTEMGGIQDGIIFSAGKQFLFDMKTVRFNKSSDSTRHPSVIPAKWRAKKVEARLEEVAARCGKWRRLGWQARYDVTWFELYIKKFKDMDVAQGHVTKAQQKSGIQGPYEKRHAELGHTTIISVGPHGSFTPILPAIIEEWGNTFAVKKTALPLEDIPSGLLGRIKSGVRKDCYSRIAFAAARGEAMEIFRRLPFVAVVGSVVKQRYSDNAIYSGNSVEGCVYKKVHDRQTFIQVIQVLVFQLLRRALLYLCLT
jgi:hypothetical protein